jgi:phosphatidylinositol glycan class A protein
VIVVTNMYPTNNGKRVGVRYMTNGLKVYYMPIVALVDQATMPTYYGSFPLFRKILLRERITIVQGHSATSPLMHECILQARIMGYRACYTDHSLFGFADAASINVNKYLKATLSDVDHCICVSHTE